MSKSQAEQLGVLFVCTGNICRSPTADGIFQSLVNQRNLQNYFWVDSAGTHAESGWHPDPRSQEIALTKGYDLSHLKARQFEQTDYQHFDYIFAMDSGHYEWMNTRRPHAAKAHLSLFLDFAGTTQDTDLIVPDPYYNNQATFSTVFNSIEKGCISILDKLVEIHSLAALSK